MPNCWTAQHEFYCKTDVGVQNDPHSLQSRSDGALGCRYRKLPKLDFHSKNAKQGYQGQTSKQSKDHLVLTSKQHISFTQVSWDLRGLDDCSMDRHELSKAEGV